jgi:D-serine deaminase-like pyridoxal phosphate-dependent protein
MEITKSTLIVVRHKVERNIRRILDKTGISGGNIRFRPHFKTHQSLEVGQWFRELGITAITVSSVDMAVYFSNGGWTDITIAILVNPLEIKRINQLAKSCKLGLLVDSIDTAKRLEQELEQPVDVWIKIDTAYHRTGIQWNLKEDILSVARSINRGSKFCFKGLLTHSGHSYNTGSVGEIKQVYEDTVVKMQGIREYLELNGIPGTEISIGDTPTCSVMEELYGVDEIRCGNFVYYDLMQVKLHTCIETDIAAALACPVIARYPQRNEIVVHGGAVHLSKESIVINGQTVFGLAALPEPSLTGWGPSLEATYVSSLSQEHGIIKTTHRWLEKINVGDILMILPVHSCLTANLMKDRTAFVKC